MSHGWNLLCAEHDTEMLDDDWNHGDDDLAEVWRRRDLIIALADLAQQHDRIDVTIEWGGYRNLTYGPVHWLRNHRDCPVVLYDEYRERKDVESMEPMRPHHCPTCTCEPRP
ncbi:MAG TPA: hypothetical protein VFH54_19400 [Mycobacteriales bacterium]|nr:hypothetical protein [Mycobacteriales bacterium]